MAKTLDVYLHSEFVGHLTQDNGGQMIFQYAESWLDRPSSAPLSQSLPLRKERFSRNECRGYFGGILPEESKREIIARNLGISARNDYAMLEQIGGECAGAVTFVPTGEPLPESDYRYRALSSEELAAVRCSPAKRESASRSLERKIKSQFASMATRSRSPWVERQAPIF